MTRRPSSEVDWVIVQRALDGEKVQATKAEKTIVVRRWQAAGRPLNELKRIQGWNVQRYVERDRETA